MASAEGSSVSGKFPDGFAWGVSTSAYQIEGSWNVDGKGRSIWDDFTHAPGHVEDSENGDVACDSYVKLDEDIKLLKEIKVSHYRFSISWPRIMPTGRADHINKAGMDYYNRLIDALLENNIQPMVTLYHWDMPAELEKIGGWLNEEIVDIFASYADFCFKEFGDRAKLWITINEPQIVAYLGYCVGLHAPGIQDPFVKPYLVSRHLILSHAKAWHIYDSKYRATQNGKVSIAINSDWAQPASDGQDPKNLHAAELYIQFTNCWFSDPIFLSGDYPPLMKDAIQKKSDEENLASSRLPTFSEEEKKMIKGTYDFYGLNYYTTRIISDPACNEQGNRIHPDLDVVSATDPSWDSGGSSWLYIVPWGLRKLLNFITKRYNNPAIFITENGCSTKHPSDATEETLQLDDTQRQRYIKSHIQEVLKAYQEDEVDVKGYFLWSLMDNFEWSAGFTERFGIYHVDFNSGTRRPRKSAEEYRKIVDYNGFE